MVMNRNKENALDVLGLPVFATNTDIMLRYKVLSMQWFPENHPNPKYAEQVFKNITEATINYVYNNKNISCDLNKHTLYSFFFSVFFNKKGTEDCCNCDSDSDDYSEDQSVCDPDMVEYVAEDYANKLIEEEERDKNKIEKRRAKKKRRKERKKLEKLANSKMSQPQKPEPVKNTSETPIKNQDSEVEEEDIDKNSAFVSVIAKKHKIGDTQVKENNSQSVPVKPPKEDPSTLVFRSHQLALQGNEMANNGHFLEAVEYFSESIKLNPTDHRFFGNRSYCYDRLGLFEKALKDSEKAITLSPTWPKGYFRKGRALLGLKKYDDSEKCFVEVLKLDSDCDEAVAELFNVKTIQIMEKGYPRELAERAIALHGSVVETLTSLIAENVSQMHVSEEIFISDDESEVISISKPKKKIPPHLYDIKRDPENPEGHTSIWVGNVQTDVTERKLIMMFGKFGELVSVKIMPEKFCAFINYKSKNSPGKAMQKYQGFELSGYKLLIRFPNLPGEPVATKKKPVNGEGTLPKGTVNGNECYYWRTTGCFYAEQCKYKHLKKNKGIDKQKWMVQ